MFFTWTVNNPRFYSFSVVFGMRYSMSSKFALFRFQKIISHSKNKFDQMFKDRKTCYWRNSPQSYCAETSKILLSSHLDATNFETPFNTSDNMKKLLYPMELFCQNPSLEDPKNCQNALKDFFLIDCKKTGFWASRKCEPNLTASEWTRRSRIVHFLPAIAS